MNLYNSQQVYKLDRLAMDQDVQPSRVLMHKAALAVWRQFQKRWAEKKHIVVFAGPGNNGGDAFAVAYLARRDGYPVELYAVGDMTGQSAESAFYKQQWEASGGISRDWQGKLHDCDLIIDGLLGIGLNKTLDTDWVSLIGSINQHAAIRVCIDIPSGLQANTGIALPVAVIADLTVTFIGRKIGCFIADGADYCGQLVYDDLGISSNTLRQIRPVVTSLEEAAIRLPQIRRNNTHKNDYGHVLIIGGDRSMSGATRLAGMAALRSGAGLVSLCVHPDNYVIAASQHAELMVGDWGDFPAMLARADVIVVGPGLGRSQSAQEILQFLTTLDKPMVVDADALHIDFITALKTEQAVLTPHPGEAARLLKVSSREVQQDRLSALKKLTDEYKQVAVLKGAGTLIGQQKQPSSICTHGHAGMATAGMGDVLAGMIAAYLAQGLDPIESARTAVLIHALAAEAYAVDADASSLIASDVIGLIAQITRRIRTSRVLTP